MINLTESNTTFEALPAGPTPARCMAVVDLGTQQEEYQGEVKPKRKIVFLFQLPEHKIDVDGESKNKVRSAFFTATLSGQGKLRPFLESWRGRAFTAEELAGFNPTAVLDKPCILNIGHRENGKDYVAGVMAPMAGQQVAELDLEPYSYSVDSPSVNADRLPQWLAEIANKSKELSEAPLLGNDVPVHTEDESAPF